MGGALGGASWVWGGGGLLRGCLCWVSLSLAGVGGSCVWV